MLNMVVFGCTAKDWEESNAVNPKKIQKEGNVVGRVMAP